MIYLVTEYASGGEIFGKYSIKFDAENLALRRVYLSLLFQKFLYKYSFSSPRLFG